VIADFIKALKAGHMHQSVATMINNVNYRHSRVPIKLLHESMQAPLLDQSEARFGHLLDDLLINSLTPELLEGLIGFFIALIEVLRVNLHPRAII
jgi:hypothetical protein